MNTSSVETAIGRRRRKRHTAEYKASVIEACRKPGVSIAAIALANSLNANMLRKWVIEAESRDGADGAEGGARLETQPAPAFIALTPPLPLPLPVSVPAEIRIELQRGAMSVKASC